MDPALLLDSVGRTVVCARCKTETDIVQCICASYDYQVSHWICWNCGSETHYPLQGSMTPICEHMNKEKVEPGKQLAVKT